MCSPLEVTDLTDAAQQYPPQTRDELLNDVLGTRVLGLRLATKSSGNVLVLYLNIDRSMPCCTLHYSMSQDTRLFEASPVQQLQVHLFALYSSVEVESSVPVKCYHRTCTVTHHLQAHRCI